MQRLRIVINIFCLFALMTVFPLTYMYPTVLLCDYVMYTNNHSVILLYSTT